jgi:aminoglycoside phosphotransferase (APT) family kinase protein
MSDFDHFTGTQAVSDKQAFDVAALSTWLDGHLPGFAGPLTVEAFKGGQSNPTYKLSTPTQSVGPRDRARVCGHERAARHRCAGAAHVLPV